MERLTQRKTLDVDRGLFLVRYAAAADEARPPRITVMPDPSSERNVTFILHPDHEEAVLWGPNACLVVRAVRDAKLCIEVERMDESSSIDATIKVERLTQGEAFSPHSVERPLLVDLSDFRVLGHVASIGDVVVSANEWLAGPSAPSRIEGLLLEWPGRPDGLDIRYSVKTARPQMISDRPVGLGTFAGTRGKAMPLVGLMLELSEYQGLNFEVEAIFLGAPVMRASGKRIVLSGPTGREPLVGLRVGLVEASVAARAQPMQAESATARASGRVRVFRSRPKQAPSIEF